MGKANLLNQLHFTTIICKTLPRTKGKKNRWMWI
jgi:hypothetical protein